MDYNNGRWFYTEFMYLVEKFFTTKAFPIYYPNLQEQHISDIQIFLKELENKLKNLSGFAHDFLFYFSFCLRYVLVNVYETKRQHIS